MNIVRCCTLFPIKMQCKKYYNIKCYIINKCNNLLCLWNIILFQMTSAIPTTISSPPFQSRNAYFSQPVKSQCIKWSSALQFFLFYLVIHQITEVKCCECIFMVFLMCICCLTDVYLPISVKTVVCIICYFMILKCKCYCTTSNNF